MAAIAYRWLSLKIHYTKKNQRIWVVFDIINNILKVKKKKKKKKISHRESYYFKMASKIGAIAWRSL